MARTLARRLLWPGIATLVVLVILLGLGTWQVQRLAWKTALLARFDIAETADPAALRDPPEPWAKVSTTGRFRPEQAVLVNLQVRDGVLGSRLVVPLERAGQPVLLVDRGWVPLEKAPPIPTPGGEVTITGYINPGETGGIFSATDDVPGRKFYTMDPAAIAKGLNLSGAEPYVLVALDPQAKGLPAPARHLPRPANSHLGYAITWYGLALALLGVFSVFAWRQRKSIES